MEDFFCMPEQIRKTVFYESEHFNVLYDIKPVLPGHFLFVPKRHVTDITQLTREEFLDFYKISSLIIPRMLVLYNSSDGSYNLTSQIGKYSGRTVPHLHIHIIPRSKTDPYTEKGMKVYADLGGNKTHSTIEEVIAEVERLRKEFKYKADWLKE